MLAGIQRRLIAPPGVNEWAGPRNPDEIVTRLTTDIFLKLKRVLMRTRFTPTPAIRSFEQDIFKIVGRTRIRLPKLFN